MKKEVNNKNKDSERARSEKMRDITETVTDSNRERETERKDS